MHRQPCLTMRIGERYCAGKEDAQCAVDAENERPLRSEGRFETVLGIARVFLGLARVFLGIARVFLGIAKVSPEIARVFLGTARVSPEIARVFLGIVRVFTEEAFE